MHFPHPRHCNFFSLAKRAFSLRASDCSWLVLRRLRHWISRSSAVAIFKANRTTGTSGDIETLQVACRLWQGCYSWLTLGLRNINHAVLFQLQWIHMWHVCRYKLQVYVNNYTLTEDHQSTTSYIQHHLSTCSQDPKRSFHPQNNNIPKAPGVPFPSSSQSLIFRCDMQRKFRESPWKKRHVSEHWGLHNKWEIITICWFLAVNSTSAIDFWCP